eukprot:TRINITY_DN40612_c1_g3_i1.p3 TRINITY_DN40612_c1_g3~~TRINITY_DN40612_c1_g3_i1.p3  ORF type:complete len:143 (-),score=19.33 TRINITY_DN40612_c1_g3_i1:424-792(-)
MTNQPDRFEKFVVPAHLKKVAFERDTKVANAGTFTIQREDHSLGNMIRMQLLEDKRILFAGYRVPHPLEHRLLIKIQTDGSITPAEALEQALKDLLEEYKHIRHKFAEELTLRQNQGDNRMY